MKSFGFLARVLALATLIAAVAATSASAQGRIFNGSRAAITQVPWQVVVFSGTSTSLSLCGGSILSPSEILTAAHCVTKVVTNDKVGASPNDGGLGVIAGTSDFKSTAALSAWYGQQTPPPAGDAEQVRIAATVGIHPFYLLSLQGIFQGPTGDVAIIRLNSPLDLSGPAAKSVPLAPLQTQDLNGTAIPIPATATISGFGQQQTGVFADGPLYLEHESILDSEACGSKVDAAVNICAGNPQATTCHGDSGSGLVTNTSPPVLIGLVSAGPSVGCAIGEPTYYTSLVAPENRAWLAGTNSPPKAPRQFTPARLIAAATPTVGGTVYCTGGLFLYDTTTTWKFTDETGRVLDQQTALSPSYVLRDSDVGHTVSCRATAVSPGGLAQTERLTSAIVQAVPVKQAPVQGAPAPLVTTVRSPTPAPGSAAASLVEPVISPATSKASVRRGRKLVISIKVTRIPAGTDHLTITAPKLGRTSRSAAGTYRATVSTIGITEQTVTVSMPVPRTAKIGRRQVAVRIVWRDGDETAHATRTARFRVKA